MRNTQTRNSEMRRTRPDCPGYSDTPATPFQRRCEAYLAPYIAHQLRETQRHWRLSFYTKPRNGDRPPAEVVQIYQEDWTLHVQVALHGDEEYADSYRKMGLRADSVLISLDVERGPSKGAPDTSAVRKSQITTREAVECSTALETLGFVLRKRGDHIVVEVAKYGESDRFVAHIVARMIACCEIVHGIAHSAMTREYDLIDS